MPIIDTTVNNYIDQQLVKENLERQAKHEPSGKLSASILYQPLRFQVLKNIGAPRKPFDAYTLAKFKRGQDVEEWYVTQLEGAGVLVSDDKELKDYLLEPSDGQPFAQYREAVGYVDSVIDTDQMQARKGVIPNEIKSVTNMKMRRVKKTGIDWHYKIQACFYALAMNVDHYAVTIVSAEDLRAETHIFPVAEMKPAVDDAITAYDEAMKLWKEEQKLPAFEPNPKVAWTANLKYAMFEPQWVERGDEWAVEQLKKLDLV